MKKYNIEDKLKDSLSGYSPVLNHDEIWENIEPQLKKRKKRRFMFFWFFGGALLLGLLFKQTLFTGEPVSIVQEESNTTQILEPTIIGASNKKVEPTIVNEVSESLTVGDIQRSNNSINLKNNNFKNALQSMGYVQREADYSNFITIPNQQEVENVTSDLPMTGYVINKGSDVKSQEMVLERVNKNVVTRDFSEAAQKVITEVISENRYTEANSKIERDDNKNSQKDGSLTIKRKYASKKMNKKKSRKSKAKSKKYKIRKKKDEKPTKKIVAKPTRKKSKYYIQPTVSLIAPVRLLNLKFPSEGFSTLQQRQETETQLEGWGIGFNVLRQSSNGFIFLAGLEYQRFNSRFGFEEMRVESRVIQGVVTETVNAQGDVISQEFGPKTITERITDEQRIYNHHTFLNVPVGIGKVWENRKYDFKFLGGLNFNLHHDFAGVIRNDDQDLPIEGGNSRSFETVYKRRTGVSFWLSSEFAKPLSKKTLIWVAPRIQVPVTDITVSEYDLSQKFLNFNLTVGASFKLN